MRDSEPEGRRRGGRPPDRKDLLLAGLLATAAYLVCHTLAAELRDGVGNFTKYPIAAAQFAAAKLGPERTLDFSPLYLRLCIWLETGAADPFSALVRFQCGSVAAAAAALFLALRRFAGIPFALLGATALVLYPGLIVHAYVFEPEALMVLWLALLLLLSTGEGALSQALAGAVMALCVLTRPGFWPLVGVLPATRALSTGSRGRREALAFVASFLFVWAGFSVTLAPALPGPSTMNPGTVLYDGNNPLSTGMRAEYPDLIANLSNDFPGEADYQHALYRLIARRSEGRELTRGEVNRWWAAKALAYAADNPAAWLAYALRKVFYAFHSHRWYDLGVAQRADDALAGRLLPFVAAGPVAALALAGLVLWRRQWRLLLAAYAGFFLQIVVIAATYASERQRLSLWPFLCFLAALGLQELRRRSALRPALGAALLMVPLSLETDLTRDDRETMRGASKLGDAKTLVLSLRDAGLLREAAEAQARALALAPWAAFGGGRPERLPATGRELAARAEALLREEGDDSPTERLHRALLLLGADEPELAELLLKGLQAEGAGLLRRQQRMTDPAYHLALIAVRRGERKRGISLLRNALTRRPGEPHVLAALAVVTNEPVYEERLSRYFDSADAAYYLGTAALAIGDSEAAAKHLQRATAIIPESRDTKVALAAALFDVGRFEEASQAYIAAMRIRPEPLLWEERILGGLARWAAETPPKHFARYIYGRALRQFGRFAEARVILAASYAATGKEIVAAELAATDADLTAAGIVK